MSTKNKKKKTRGKHKGKQEYPPAVVARKVSYPKKDWLVAISLLVAGLLGILPLLRYLFFGSTSSMGIPVLPLILGVCSGAYGLVLLFKGVYLKL